MQCMAPEHVLPDCSHWVWLGSESLQVCADVTWSYGPGRLRCGGCAVEDARHALTRAMAWSIARKDAAERAMPRAYQF